MSAVYEPYFLRWDSLLFQPHGSKEQIPLYEHKTCKKSYRTFSKYPKRICPGCGIDTAKEQCEIEEREAAEGVKKIIIP